MEKTIAKIEHCYIIPSSKHFPTGWMSSPYLSQVARYFEARGTEAVLHQLLRSCRAQGGYDGVRVEMWLTAIKGY